MSNSKEYIMHKLNCLCFFTLSLFSGFSTDGSDIKDSSNETLNMLKSTDSDSRLNAYRVIAEKRNNIVSGLIEVVEDIQAADKAKKELVKNPSWGLAVKLLGEYRAVEAIPVLVKHISYYPFWVYEGTLVPPARDALIKIGTPAADYILREKLLDATDRDLREYILVFNSTWGKDLAYKNILVNYSTVLDVNQKDRLLKILKDFSYREQFLLNPPKAGW
jgi:hypothetical protein